MVANRSSTDRQVFQAEFAPDLLQELPAVDRFHHDIEQDEGRGIASDHLEGLENIRYDERFVADPGQQDLHQFEDGLVVLDKHDLI